MTTLRRAVVVCRNDVDSEVVERLVRVHGLRVVYTVYTDTGPELSARIAVQHALDFAADVVLIPHINGPEVEATRAWQAVTWIADLVTATGTFDGGP